MRFWLAFSVLTSSVLAACPKPTERPAARESAAATGERGQRRAGPSRGPSRVHPLLAGQELGGPNATGTVGDWVLENDEVVFVVDGLGRQVGLAESGGNIIDAADAKTRRDELGQMATHFGTFPRQAVYVSIDARTEADGTAVIVSRGTELYEPSVEIVTELRLVPGARAVAMRTTLTNGGTTTVRGLGLGDAIQWGGAEKIAPGKPFGFKGPSRGAFVGAVGRVASYAITSREGEIAATSGGSWTDTEQRKDVAIDPGKSVVYERLFVVGERPDLASIATELTRAAGGRVGGIEVGLVDQSGAPVKTLAGAKANLEKQGAGGLLSLVALGDDGIRGNVPPGTYAVSFAPSMGRRGDGTVATVDVKSGVVTTVTLPVTDAGSLSIGPCREPDAKGVRAAVPCKVTIEGLDGAPKPDLGPGHVAGGAKNVVFLRPGVVAAVPLAFGRYRLTASRGPEYDLSVAEVALPRTEPVGFELRRVVDTAGYVAADFHQHTILSADAPVATRDRVIANAAEGVEVAVSSEHNTIADLAPIAKELGLDPWVVQIAGDEMTSDSSTTPFGHANVYPLEPLPGTPRGGAPAVRDRLASDVFADARALPGGPHVLQINHPRFGRTGYFDQLGFDSKTGVGSGAGYDAQFDALEVWNGPSIDLRARVLDDFFALLRTSHPVTPVANTDTHGIVGEEPGYPRTFVRVGGSTELPLSAWDARRSQELVTAIRETRDVVMSNGPFLSVKANGVGIGGLAAPRHGAVVVDVTVTSAPWVLVDRVALRSARGGLPARPAVPLRTKKNAAGALVGRVRFTLEPKEDDAFVVIVEGDKPMRPVLSGGDAEDAPWAMSAPIWIDADGDGKALGRER